MTDIQGFVMAIVIGVPVVGGLLYAAYEHATKMRLKMRELDIEEQRVRMEAQLRTDELNAKILRMDDMGMSPNEMAALSEQVRQLREEIASLKQGMNDRTMG